MIVFTITLPNGDVETLKTSRKKITVGGSWIDNIMLLKWGIQPRHGVFQVTGEELFYTDKGYGTFINNHEIINESIFLSSGDSVRIGEIIVTYVIEQQDISTQKPPPTMPDTIKNTSHLQRGPAQQTSPITTAFTEHLSSTVRKKTSEDYYEKIIILLMLLFWPLGFLLNVLFWYHGVRNIKDVEELESKYIVIKGLLVSNTSCLSIFLWLITTVFIISLGG